MQDRFAVTTMDHAEQIVRPHRRPPRPAVAQGNERELPHLLRYRSDLSIGHIPHHHSVGAVTEFTVTHDHTQPADHTAMMQLG